MSTPTDAAARDAQTCLECRARCCHMQVDLDLPTIARLRRALDVAPFFVGLYDVTAQPTRAYPPKTCFLIRGHRYQPVVKQQDNGRCAFLLPGKFQLARGAIYSVRPVTCQLYPYDRLRNDPGLSDHRTRCPRPWEGRPKLHVLYPQGQEEGQVHPGLVEEWEGPEALTQSTATRWREWVTDLVATGRV